MINRTPIPRDQRPPIPAFTPVPRKCVRHDGWTPERQRAFIEALADTGSVSTAARMVNMSAESAYALRRHPEAGEWRRAWQAALDMGVQRLKDEAFERAINGQLVPVFVAGKLMGFRRKKNDRLLMFCLRHFGRDTHRININYTLNRASAHEIRLSPVGESEGPAAKRREGAGLPASPRPALPHPTTAAPPGGGMPHEDAAAEAVAAFEGVELDPQAQSEIMAVLEACAARQRTIAPADDPERAYVPLAEIQGPYTGELESGVETRDCDLKPGEVPWTLLGDEPALAAVDAAFAAVEAEQALPEPERAALDQQRKVEFAAADRRNNLPAKRKRRPRLSRLPEADTHHALYPGPNMMQRLSARQATERCIEEARREWIAAETEESWREWKGGGGGGKVPNG